MDFAYGPRVEELRTHLQGFMDDSVYPAEARYEEEMREAADPHHHPEVIEELKAEARSRGLWNLFLPDPDLGAGLSVLEYAPLAEITGRSPEIAPEAINCAAPDTGNMEILHQFGTTEQKETWLGPLLDGEIRSCFSMTEPDVASSDATNIRTRITRDGDEYVITGRKWFSSGAASERCKVSIVMGVTDPDAEPHRRQSMVLVPMATPGVEVERQPTVFGYQDRGGHPQIHFDDVRVPIGNLLGEQGGGFAIAQSRLGPGRIHHCMRTIGKAEKALDLMVSRGLTREAFGKKIAHLGGNLQIIAQARCEIEAMRLMVLKAAKAMDVLGNKEARIWVSMVKAMVPERTCKIIDQAIQMHGATGISQWSQLGEMYQDVRHLRFADGPDEVHWMVVGRHELSMP